METGNRSRPLYYSSNFVSLKFLPWSLFLRYRGLSRPMWCDDVMNPVLTVIISQTALRKAQLSLLRRACVFAELFLCSDLGLSQPNYLNIPWTGLHEICRFGGTFLRHSVLHTVWSSIHTILRIIQSTRQLLCTVVGWPPEAAHARTRQAVVLAALFLLTYDVTSPLDNRCASRGSY